MIKSASQEVDANHDGQDGSTESQIEFKVGNSSSPMTTATSNQLFATIIISFAFGLKIIVTMNLITIFKWLLNVYSYPNISTQIKESLPLLQDQAGSYVKATCRRPFRDYSRAHNLCHDNRQLIVIAINRNHSASKINCN